MKTTMLFVTSMILVFNCIFTKSQQRDIFEFRDISEAIEKGTRTRQGIPGTRYWQNSSDYQIIATVDTGKNTLDGHATIKYHNNSPDSLRSMMIRLYQDLYKKGSSRMEPLAGSIITEGVFIDSLSIDDVIYIRNNIAIEPRKVTRYGTLLYIRLDELIRKGATAKVEVAWRFTLPDGFKASLDRMGRFRNAIFMGLWYPQIAVYDDISGWDNQPHLGTMEFYNDFNNYDVVVNAPEGYMVWATGECMNLNEVLSEKIIRRLEIAKTTDSIIDIIKREDYSDAVVKGNRWHFRADHVPDFAFATAPGYLWQGTSVVVDKQSKRRVLLDIASPNDSLYGFKSLDVFRAAITWSSDSFPGVPFPYEHSTIFLNGSKNKGSMEYPMMVNNSSYMFRALHNAVIVHESYHCYMPFYMGFNETRYMWMDEGFTNFNEHKFTGDGISLQATEMPTYAQLAGKLMDYPLMFFKAEEISGFFSFMTYLKHCNNLIFLETLLGKEKFLKATKRFMSDWNGKHPTPYDMFYSYSTSANEDLNWFWNAFYFEPGFADLAIKSVEKKAIIIENRGNKPVPIYLEVTYDDNSKEKAFANLDVWKTGLKEYTVRFQGNRNIKSVKLGNFITPDADNTNNSFVQK